MNRLERVEILRHPPHYRVYHKQQSPWCYESLRLSQRKRFTLENHNQTSFPSKNAMITILQYMWLHLEIRYGYNSKRACSSEVDCHQRMKLLHTSWTPHNVTIPIRLPEIMGHICRPHIKRYVRLNSNLEYKRLNSLPRKRGIKFKKKARHSDAVVFNVINYSTSVRLQKQTQVAFSIYASASDTPH
jgi:hypothetical protein